MQLWQRNLDFLWRTRPRGLFAFRCDPPTDLNLHPQQSWLRLILNNVLFPAAKKKKQKT